MNTPQFKFKRAMIVDDTKIDRYVAMHTMKKNVFAEEIIEFDMATKAIKFLEEHKANPDMLPEIIVLDIRMPQMNGFEFLEELAKIPQAVNQMSVIMLSSSLSTEDHKRAQNSALVKRFFNKPLNAQKLSEIKVIYHNTFLQVTESE